MRMNASRGRGETLTSFRMRAPIRPATSATPAPIIAMNVMPTTLKPVKLATKDVKMKRMPSTVSRLWIGMTCSAISKSSA